jgi:hypothetical protein
MPPWLHRPIDTSITVSIAHAESQATGAAAVSLRERLEKFRESRLRAIGARQDHEESEQSERDDQDEDLVPTAVYGADSTPPSGMPLLDMPVLWLH